MLNITLIGWRRSFSAVLRRQRHKLNQGATRSHQCTRDGDDEPIVDIGTYIEINKDMLAGGASETVESLEADVAEFLALLEKIVSAPAGPVWAIEAASYRL